MLTFSCQLFTHGARNSKLTLRINERSRHVRRKSGFLFQIVMVLSLTASMPFFRMAGPLFAEPHGQVSASGSDPLHDAFQQALVALKENKLEAALEQLTEAESESSSDARIRNFRGIVLARLGRNDEAANEYREAIRLDARMEDPHRNLGFLEWTDHHLENARAELQRALELAPDDAFAHYYLGRVQLDAKFYADAFQELERSKVPWPSDAEFLMQAAAGYNTVGQQEEARKIAERLTRMQLSDAQSVRAAGLLVSVHADAATIDLLRKVQAQQSWGSTWARYDLALGYLLTGDYEQAASSAHDYLATLKAGDNTPSAAHGWSVSRYRESTSRRRSIRSRCFPQGSGARSRARRTLAELDPRADGTRPLRGGDLRNAGGPCRESKFLRFAVAHGSSVSVPRIVLRGRRRNFSTTGSRWRSSPYQLHRACAGTAPNGSRSGCRQRTRGRRGEAWSELPDQLFSRAGAEPRGESRRRRKGHLRRPFD